jgi:uncharacterized protein
VTRAFEGPGPDAVFAAQLTGGRFAIQRCSACAHRFFVPRVLCPRCGSAEHDWVDVSGEGVVYSTTTLRRSVKDGGDLNLALVDLAEGPRMLSRVGGLPPERVHIGLRVRARIAAGTDGAPLVVFDPLEPQR